MDFPQERIDEQDANDEHTDDDDRQLVSVAETFKFKNSVVDVTESADEKNAQRA